MSCTESGDSCVTDRLRVDGEREYWVILGGSEKYYFSTKLVGVYLSTGTKVRNTRQLRILAVMWQLMLMLVLRTTLMLVLMLMLMVDA